MNAAGSARISHSSGREAVSGFIGASGGSGALQLGLALVARRVEQRSLDRFEPARRGDLPSGEIGHVERVGRTLAVVGDVRAEHHQAAFEQGPSQAVEDRKSTRLYS